MLHRKGLLSVLLHFHGGVTYVPYQAGQVYGEEERLKAAPSPPGCGLTTPPLKQQLVTETATTKFAP